MRLSSLLVPLLPITFVHAIWPIPVSYTSGTDVLWIDRDVQIIVNGVTKVGPLLGVQEPRSPHHTVHANDGPQSYGGELSASERIINAAIEKTQETLFEFGFVPWKFFPRNEDFEPRKDEAEFVKSITLTLEGGYKDDEKLFDALAGESDECYTLSLPMSGAVEIKAKTAVGLSRGLVTFTQLFYKHSEGGVYTPLVPVEIMDKPKFPHRGINMDVARNWFEVKDIKRMIDAAAYNKMNRFHLHVTDGQSWPLEIPALPELAKKGAYRSDLTYSPKDIAEIQIHGALQGVQVYLETDMPGHTSSIWHAYPELIASYNKQPDWNTYAAEPPSGTLKLNSPAVCDFLETLFDDLLPRLRPYSTYYHTGGDEVAVNAYLNDETVQSNDTKILQPLMQRFIDRNHDQLRQHGYTPIVWEEMLLTWNLTLASDVVIQTWQSDAALLHAVQKGHKALAGNYNYWYLDCGHGQWINAIPDSPGAPPYPYLDYCTPRKNWRLMYSYDPLAGIPDSLQHLVLGGECHIWAEQTDPVNLDRNVWPRAAAAAEVLWSGAKDEMGRNRSQVEAAPRLSEMRERLVARGVGAEPVQMVFCLMEEGQCSL